MDVTRECAVVVAVVATSGCVAILGLDSGVAEDPDGAADASAPDRATSPEDSGRGDAGASDDETPIEETAAIDVADDRARDAAVASDATHTADADAGCRAALQPCQVNSECCSGTCGVGLTCL